MASALDGDLLDVKEINHIYKMEEREHLKRHSAAMQYKKKFYFGRMGPDQSETLADITNMVINAAQNPKGTSALWSLFCQKVWKNLFEIQPGFIAVNPRPTQIHIIGASGRGDYVFDQYANLLGRKFRKCIGRITLHDVTKSQVNLSNIPCPINTDGTKESALIIISSFGDEQWRYCYERDFNGGYLGYKGNVVMIGLGDVKISNFATDYKESWDDDCYTLLNVRTGRNNEETIVVVSGITFEAKKVSTYEPLIRVGRGSNVYHKPWNEGKLTLMLIECYVETADDDFFYNGIRSNNLVVVNNNSTLIADGCFFRKCGGSALELIGDAKAVVRGCEFMRCCIGDWPDRIDLVTDQSPLAVKGQDPVIGVSFASSLTMLNCNVHDNYGHVIQWLDEAESLSDPSKRYDEKPGIYGMSMTDMEKHQACLTGDDKNDFDKIVEIYIEEQFKEKTSMGECLTEEEIHRWRGMYINEMATKITLLQSGIAKRRGKISIIGDGNIFHRNICKFGNGSRASKVPGGCAGQTIDNNVCPVHKHCTEEGDAHVVTKRVLFCDGRWGGGCPSDSYYFENHPTSKTLFEYASTFIKAMISVEQKAQLNWNDKVVRELKELSLNSAIDSSKVYCEIINAAHLQTKKGGLFLVRGQESCNWVSSGSFNSFESSRSTREAQNCPSPAHMYCYYCANTRPKQIKPAGQLFYPPEKTNTDLQDYHKLPAEKKLYWEEECHASIIDLREQLVKHYSQCIALAQAPGTEDRKLIKTTETDESDNSNQKDNKNSSDPGDENEVVQLCHLEIMFGVLARGISMHITGNNKKRFLGKLENPERFIISCIEGFAAILISYCNSPETYAHLDISISQFYKRFVSKYIELLFSLIQCDGNKKTAYFAINMYSEHAFSSCGCCEDDELSGQENSEHVKRTVRRVLLLICDLKLIEKFVRKDLIQAVVDVEGSDAGRQALINIASCMAMRNPSSLWQKTIINAVEALMAPPRTGPTLPGSDMDNTELRTNLLYTIVFLQSRKSIRIVKKVFSASLIRHSLFKMANYTEFLRAMDTPIDFDDEFVSSSFSTVTGFVPKGTSQKKIDEIHANMTNDLKENAKVHNENLFSNGIDPSVACSPDIRTCAQCGKESEELKVCAKCKMTYYCNYDCQKLHWKVHKSTCKTSLELERIRRVESYGTLEGGGKKKKKKKKKRKKKGSNKA